MQKTQNTGKKDDPRDKAKAQKSLEENKLEDSEKPFGDIDNTTTNDEGGRKFGGGNGGFGGGGHGGGDGGGGGVPA